MVYSCLVDCCKNIARIRLRRSKVFLLIVYDLSRFHHTAQPTIVLQRIKKYDGWDDLNILRGTANKK